MRNQVKSMKDRMKHTTVEKIDEQVCWLLNPRWAGSRSPA